MIPVTRSSMPPIEEYFDEIRDLWDSHWLTNMGPKHALLQTRLAEYMDVPCVSLFTNGHLALEAAIEALDISGEVITTPFTFASTAHALVRRGLTPVFCDIDPSDYTIDASKLESCITDKTSAILPVHVYGSVCDVDAIDSIAKAYGLKVIYDAAHAFGVNVRGRGVASFGDASMFSFHATKVFHTIEGGAVAYADETLSRKLDYAKDFGIDGPDAVRAVGGNGKMSEFQAAMGLCNLRHVADEIEKRRAIAERYSERLDGIRGIRLHRAQPSVDWNCAYYPVLFDGFRLDRDAVFEKLAQNGVHARKYFSPPVNAYECYRGRYDPDATPIAKYVSERIMTLPMYSALTMEDVDRICAIILD